MARYGMAFDYNLCINCKACEIACKEENGIDLGAKNHRLWIISKEPEGDFWELDRSTVEFMPKQCNHCEHPLCLEACDQKAISIKDNGIVMIDRKLCELAQLCMSACPYGAIYTDEDANVADKCTFCYDTRLSQGKTTTACQITCPSKVRIFGDLDDPKSEISQVLKTREYFTLKPEKKTKPKLFYLKGRINS